MALYKIYASVTYTVSDIESQGDYMEVEADSEEIAQAKAWDIITSEWLEVEDTILDIDFTIEEIEETEENVRCPKTEELF